MTRGDVKVFDPSSVQQSSGVEPSGILGSMNGVDPNMRQQF